MVSKLFFEIALQIGSQHAIIIPDKRREKHHVTNLGEFERREIVDVYPNEYMRDISNHVPVTLRITDEDNDNTPSGDWGV